MESELETIDDDLSVDVLYEHDRLVDESFEAVVRLLDTHDALSHLVAARPGMTDHEFRESSTSIYTLAVAGTGISLESLDMSFEASENALVSIAKAIGRAIAEFFKRFMVWMSEIDIVVSILRRRAFMMQKAAIAARGRTVDKPYVTLNRLHRYLRRGHSYVQDSIRLEYELKILLNVCTIAFGDLPNDVLRALDKMPTIVTASDKKSACIDIVETIPFQRIANKLSMKSVPRERFMRDNVQGTSPLMGGKSIFLFQSDLREKGTVGLRFHGFQYADSTIEQFAYAPTKQFDTLGPLDIVKLPDVLIEILGAVSRAANSTTLAKIKRAKSVSENFSMRIAQDGTLSTGDRDYIRKTVNALMYWSTNISRPLGNDAISVCKAVLHYCHSSLKAQR